MISKVGFSVLLAMAAASVGGCAAFRSLAGRNTIDLEGAQVRSMGVDIRKQQKTICPRERVQMAVFADVVLKGDSQVKKVETWSGSGDASRNGKLDFTEFAFQSELGRVDENGWFAPNPDVSASAAKEIEIKTVFRRRPDKFTFSTTYKPDYRCIHDLGESASAGAAGQAGQTGSNGSSGSTGFSESAGGSGGNGTPGGSGGPGGQGANGPRFVAYATLVKTPFYDKLVAISIDGGSGSDFVLAHLEGKLTIVARGGDGGPGGNGGRGGDGGNGGSGNPGGSGGSGAQGGSGGNGGNGGGGGNIDLIFDDRFPELRDLIQLDVAGGAGGPGGSGASGGNAGQGGTGMNNGASGGAGQAGSGGAAGPQGSPGPNGTANKQPGQPADKFGNRAGITVL